MHEYIEIRFRQNGKPFRLKRQIDAGFEFDEPHPLTRTIGKPTNHLDFCGRLGKKKSTAPFIYYRVTKV